MAYVFNPFTGTFDVVSDAASSPGGSTGQVQFNDSGSFGGDAGMTYDKTTDTLSLLGNILTTGGTAAAPSHSFVTDTDTGVYIAGTNILGLTTAGTSRVLLNANGNVGIATSGTVLNNAKFSINTNTDKNFIMVGTNGSPEIASINDAYNVYQELRINGSPLLLNNAATGNIQIGVGGGNLLVGGTTGTHKLTVLSASTATVLSLASSIVSSGSPVTFSMTSGPGLIMTAGSNIQGINNGSFAIINSVSTATLPVYAFRNATTTGMGTPSSGSTDITFTCGGTERARINVNGITSSGSFTGGVGGSAAASIVNGQRWNLASSGTSGDFLIRNESLTGPVKIQFGGTTASFPSIENIGANIIIRSANATNATRVGIGAVSPAAMLDVTALSDVTIGAIFRSASASAVNLMEWRDSAGSTRMKINQNFVFFPVQATTAGAPAYVLGGMYFDTTLNKLRIGGATGWETVTSV